jgi:hypothetical protein
MWIILSYSVYSLIVYLSCIMQRVNNILIVCFQKNYENLCPSHDRPSFGLSCGYSNYMAKAVLEYCVRHVVTNSLEISFQRSLLTANRCNDGGVVGGEVIARFDVRIRGGKSCYDKEVQ